MSVDDQRAAVSMWTTLSTQVMAASLAMIAVVGAFATFALEKRVPPRWFPFIVGIDVLFFVFSILSGGVGISKLSKAGYGGDWKLSYGEPYFKRQTVSCLLGLVFFFLALFFSGPSKEQSLERDLRELQQTVGTLQQEPSPMAQIEQLRSDLKSARDELDRLREEVEVEKARGHQAPAGGSNPPK